MVTAKIIVGLTLGTFIACAVTSREWGIAADRSWHMACAVLLYAWLAS